MDRRRLGLGDLLALRRFRLGLIDRPSGKHLALRRGVAALGQLIAALGERRQRRHLALAAVCVKADGHGRRGLGPLGDQGDVLGHGDDFVYIIDAFLFALGRFRIELPAGEHHALRRGEAALGQAVAIGGILRNGLHLALAAVCVKGDGHGDHDGPPLGGHGGVRGDIDHVARAEHAARGRRFCLRLNGFCGDLLSRRFAGLFAGRFLRHSLGLLGRLGRHGLNAPALKRHALRRGEAALGQGVAAVLVGCGALHRALGAIAIEGDDDGLGDRLPLGGHQGILGESELTARRIDGFHTVGHGFGHVLLDLCDLGRHLRLRLGLLRPDRPADKFHALRRGKFVLRQDEVGGLIRLGGVGLRRCRRHRGGRNVDLHGGHFALAAVAVEGHGDGPGGLDPLGRNGGVAQQLHGVAGLVDGLIRRLLSCLFAGCAALKLGQLAHGLQIFRDILGKLGLRQVHIHLPAREHHALGGGEGVLRQCVLDARRHLGPFHLALAAVSVKGHGDGLGQGGVGDPVAAIGVHGVIVALRVLLDDGVIDLHAVCVHGDVVEDKVPFAVGGHILAFGIHGRLGHVFFVVHLGGLGDLEGALIRRVVEVVIGHGGSALSLFLVLILGHQLHQRGARPLGGHVQGGDDLAVGGQVHDHALGTVARLVVIVGPQNAAGIICHLRVVGVGHAVVFDLAAIALDLIGREGIFHLLRVHVLGQGAKVIRPFALGRGGDLLQILLASGQVQRHFLWTQPVGVLVVPPLDGAGDLQIALRRVDHGDDHGAVIHGGLLGLIPQGDEDLALLGAFGRGRGLGLAHLEAIALGGIGAALGLVHPLPDGPEGLNVALHDALPAVLGADGDRVGVLRIVVGGYADLKRFGPELVHVFRVLPDDLKGTLALAQPLAGQGGVLHQNQRLAGPDDGVFGVGLDLPA